MSQKQLNIYYQRDNIDRLTTAFPLCIILSEEKLKPWFYQNYLEIFSITSNFIDVLYNDCLNYNSSELSPLEIKTISYQFLSQEIINFIKEYIEREYYLIIFVDEFYMRNSENYLKKHYNHEYLIYGYDQSKKSLSGIGFLNHEFTVMNFLFDDFSKAFESAKNQPHRSDFPLDHELHIVRKREYKHSFPFQIQEFRDKISRYLSSSMDPATMYIKCIDDYSYHLGISVYRAIIEHMDCYCMGTQNESYNSIHAFYEHKVGILTRLHYINERYPYHLDTTIKEYQELVKQVKLIRMLYLKVKYSVSSKEKICEKIKTKLNLCREKEYEILSKLLLII